MKNSINLVNPRKYKACTKRQNELFRLVPEVTRDPGLAKDLAVMHLRDLAATTTIAMYLAREIRDRKGTVANEVIVLRS